MPELPEVENFKKISRGAFGLKITSVEIVRPRTIGGAAPGRFAVRLKGRRFTGARRHGKHLLLQTDGGFWVALHFGLSGFLRYTRRAKNAKGGVIFFHFEDGSRLAYSALFGKASIVRNPDDFTARQKLGPDALGIKHKDFEKILRGSKRDVKSVLMDQRLLAGVGNMYSDEALFRTRLHPRTLAQKLDSRTLAKLHANLDRVLKETIACRLHGESGFPPHSLSERREPGQHCPRCRAALKSIPHSGRKAYFCPRCQPLSR